jgi:hypothetical protein
LFGGEPDNSQRLSVMIGFLRQALGHETRLRSYLGCSSGPKICVEARSW